MTGARKEIQNLYSAIALGVQGESRISNTNLIQRSLGAYTTSVVPQPGEVGYTPDAVATTIFNRGTYIDQLLSLFKYVSELEAQSLLQQPFEDTSEITPLEKITSDYQKVRKWYGAVKVGGSQGYIYLDVLVGRVPNKNADDNIEFSINRISTACVEAGRARQEEQEQFYTSVQSYASYMQKSWFGKALELLRRYGPELWARIKADAKDIKDGAIHIALLPVVLAKAITWDTGRTIFYLLRSSNACDLLHTTAEPTAETLGQLSLHSHAAYVRCADKLFYVDKLTGECQHLESVDAATLEVFDRAVDLQSLVMGTARTLTDHERSEVKRITNHEHHNYRAKTRQKIVEGFQSIGSSVASFFKAIVRVIAQTPRALFTADGRAELWSGVKEKSRQLLLWVTQHPLKAVAWLVFGAGLGVGTHFLAPIIASAMVGGVATGELTVAILGTRIAAWATSALIEVSRQLPDSKRLQQALSLRVDQALLQKTNIEDPDKDERAEYIRNLPALPPPAAAAGKSSVGSYNAQFTKFDFSQFNFKPQTKSTSDPLPSEEIDKVKKKQQEAITEEQKADRKMAQANPKIEKREAKLKENRGFFTNLFGNTSASKYQTSTPFARGGVLPGISSDEFSPVDNAGGGDCFYHVVAQHLLEVRDAPVSYEVVRLTAVNYIAQHRGEFAAFFADAPDHHDDGTGNIDEFIAHHSQSGIDTNERMIWAVAKAFTLSIKIHYPDGHVIDQHRIKGVESEVHVYHIQSLDPSGIGGHYLYLKPTKDPALVAEAEV